ncbi:MAG: hypothetical protein AAFX58_08375 [Pseudomonadota bacterium]
MRTLIEGAGLVAVAVPEHGPIPHSYWGAPEAGLTDAAFYVSAATPLHSVLHELCHFLVMPPARRARLDTDAGGDDAEEQSVCYAQALLADGIEDYGRERLFAEMDAWGYSFREGSAAAWFAGDGRAARAGLASVRAHFRYLASHSCTASCHATLLAGLKTQ